MRLLKLSLFTLFVSSIFQINTLSAQTREWRTMHMGNAAFRAHKYDKASSYYIQALKINPNNARALFNLADTYLANGDAHAADSLYNEVAQKERNTVIKAMARHNQGYIRQKMALTETKHQQQLLRQAIEHYKQALRLNPRDNDTRYNMVLCMRQLKNQAQDKQQQNENENKNEQNRQKQDSKQPQQTPRPSENPQQKLQTDQYINLSQQAERRTLEKLNGQQPRQKSLDKNW